MIARRKLKKEAAHFITQGRRDLIVLLHEPLGANHAQLVGDALIDLYAVDEVRRRIPFPAADGWRRGPAIEGGIELHRAKYVRIVAKPVLRGGLLYRIEKTSPVRVESTGASYVNLHFIWTSRGGKNEANAPWPFHP